MIAEIISIGTELILGDIVDTNSYYVADKLTNNGIDIHYISTVGDNKKRIVSLLKKALTRADIIITTGGLGPTDDDLTRESIAEATGKPLRKVPDLMRKIKNYFKQNNYLLTENNLKQAYLPVSATAIPNAVGTAPGILLKTEDNIIISLPGVPREMKYMFVKEVVPYLGKITSAKIGSKTLNFFGITESNLETEIKEILDRQDNPTIALLAGDGEVKIRITAKGRSNREIEELISVVEREIRERVGEYIYGVNDEDLAGIVGRYLEEKKLSLAVAESCTGGLLANRITNITGSSQYFKGGIVSYTNQVKKEQLGVNYNTLETFGAVSRETAKEMAEGVREKMNTDFALSVTGIAGPGGGSKTKPVGLIFIGLASKDNTKTFKLELKGDRSWNKWVSSQYALYYLFKNLKGN